MLHDPPVDLFRERLLGDTDFEIAGSDCETGIGYRVSVRRGDIDVAAFSRIDPLVLQSSIAADLPLAIGASLYRIEHSFGPIFLRAVREAARVAAISVTVQSHRQIVTIIGDKPLPIAEVLKNHVPPTLEWAPNTLLEGSREWGRKVGHAAKDLAGLHEATFGLEHLETLERSGEVEAYEAVRKEAVWLAPSLDRLRAQGIPPTVAFGIVSCWRMLKQRPARNPAFRLAFVRDLPAFRAALERCRTLNAFLEVVTSYVDGLGGNAAAIVGSRLRCFARRIKSRNQTFYSQRGAILNHILAIDVIREAEVQWASANKATGRSRSTRD